MQAKKEAATKLKYTYSMLAQAILLSEKDNGIEITNAHGHETTKKLKALYIHVYTSLVMILGITANKIAHATTSGV